MNKALSIYLTRFIFDGTYNYSLNCEGVMPQLFFKALAKIRLIHKPRLFCNFLYGKIRIQKQFLCCLYPVIYKVFYWGCTDIIFKNFCQI